LNVKAVGTSIAHDIAVVDEGKTVTSRRPLDDYLAQNWDELKRQLETLRKREVPQNLRINA
jgi:hypothetical protein